MGKIINFQILDKGVNISLADGNSIFIRFNEDSGMIICRKKKHTLFSVDHPGIYLGEEVDGDEWVIHNHILNKKAVIDTLSKFSNEQQIKEYSEIKPTNDWKAIIEEGLNAVIEGKPYSIFNNCQHLVTKAATNKSFSPDLKKIGGTVALAGAAALASKNKYVRRAGIVAIILGGGAAVYDSLKK